MLAANQQYMNKVQQSSLLGKSSAHGQTQQTQQQQQQPVKNGRIGIFGNYLASRISSIQQQKFLLQSNGSGGGGSSALHSSAQTSTELTTQRRHHQTPHRNSSGKLPAQKPIDAADFSFPAGSGSGPVEKRNRSTVVTGGGAATATTSIDGGGGGSSKASPSPFTASAKAKAIHQTNIVMVLPDSHKDSHSNKRDGSSMSAAEQAITHQQLARKLYNAGQREYVRRHDAAGPDLIVDPRQSYEGYSHKSGEQQRSGAGTETSNKNTKKQQLKGASNASNAVNKSYQGGLTNLLKQVYNHELEQQQKQSSSYHQPAKQRTSSIKLAASHKSNDRNAALKPKNNFQDVPTFFSSGTFGEEQFSTFDHTTIKHSYQTQGYQTQHQKHHHQAQPTTKTSQHLQHSLNMQLQQPTTTNHQSQLSSSAQTANEKDHSQSGTMPNQPQSHQQQTQQQQQQQQTTNQNNSVVIRSHSHTPHQDCSILTTAGDETLQGNISPMQVRKGSTTQNNNAFKSNQTKSLVNKNQQQQQNNRAIDIDKQLQLLQGKQSAESSAAAAGSNSINNNDNGTVLVHRSFDQQVIDIAIDKIQGATKKATAATSGNKQHHHQQQLARDARQLPLSTQAAAIAFQTAAGSTAKFIDSSRQQHGGGAGKSVREDLIKRGTTKQYLNSANLPLNSKLNAALRQNGKLGLGPCLEERQMNMIDKIWGNFNSEYDEGSSKKQLAVASARMSAVAGSEVNQKTSQPVQLVDSNKKRKRNELPYTQSGSVVVPSSKQGKQIKIEDIPPTAVFLQQSETSTSNAKPSRSNGGAGKSAAKQQSAGDRKKLGGPDDASANPVWLPKKSLIHRNTVGGAPLPGEATNGHRSQNIDETALALQRSNEDEGFDYKDFNFIVGKQKGSQLAKQLTNNSKATRSNSPSMIRNSRYAAEQQLKNQALSENYHLMKQYGQKRLSTEILTTTQIPLNNGSSNNGQKLNHAASIKIQIEDSKQQQLQLQQRAASKLTQEQANSLFRSSQSNLYKIDQNQYGVAQQSQQQSNNKNAYLSLSQKKKNQQYWNVPHARPLPKDELKNLYHVTIQIDPSTKTSPMRLSPDPNSPQNQLYQLQHQYQVVKQGVLPIKQHVIQGIPGSYNVNSNPFEANPQFFEVGATRNGLAAASQNRNAVNVLSPRVNDRKALVFSPEPKLIELLTDEGRMKTIPIMYPIIPKRQNQSNGNNNKAYKLGMGAGDEQRSSQLDGCLMHSSRDSNYHSAAAANDGLDNGAAAAALEEFKDGAHGETSITSKKNAASSQGRQPYFCPYARERMAKQKAERERRVAASESIRPAVASEAQANAAAGLEEAKTDLRTAEQKAEDLKNHQKELMRKFLSKFPPKKLPNIHAELEEERQRFVQARKDANKKYTEISANNNKPGKFAPLKFVIFEGNNSNIVRKVMQSRLACNMPDNGAPGSPTRGAKGAGDQTTTASEGENNLQTNSTVDKQVAQNYTTWQETNAPHLFNFKWKPTSNGINFERLGKFGFKQLVSHIDGHQALTTKDQLFFNMKAYCEKKNLDVYDMIPLTFAVDFQDHNHSQKFDQILQIISIFEKNITLSPAELNGKLQTVQTAIDKVVRSPLTVGPSEHQGKNLWLLKPTGFNRGIGIHVFNSCEDLRQILWTHYRIQVNIPQHYRTSNSPTPDTHNESSQARDVFSQRDREIQKLSNQIAQDEQNADPEAKQAASSSSVKEIKNSSFIVQKYIEAPLLFRKRKFDIRIWSLISHDARFYLFKEAYVRTSSEEYDLSGEKLDQVYVHLTNNAVQKYSKNYGKFEEGNIVSVKALAQELASQDQFASSLSADQIETALYKQMREQIQLSYEAVRSKLRFSKHSFELVGYDFMVVPVVNGSDSSTQCEFKTKLIEANTNPCLEESNQLLKDLIPRMLDDMLKIVLDPLFGTTLAQQEQSAAETENGIPVVLNYPVEGHADHDNMFELIASPVVNYQ